MIDLSAILSAVLAIAAIVACVTTESPNQATYRRASRRNRKG